MNDPDEQVQRELDELEIAADPIEKNIADILALENRELARANRAQRLFAAVSTFLSRPGYLLALLLLVIGWTGFNVLAPSFGLPRFDPPPFPWLGGLLTLVALLTTAIVLIGQQRQSALAEQRARMDLQINLLSEQKVTKLIHLLEELRTDLPGVRNRHDPHVSRLAKPADPAQLASALGAQERTAKGDTPEGG